MLSSPGDIYYVKTLTFTLYCGGVCGVGDNQGVACWYWPDVGLQCLKYSEPFAMLRLVRISVPQIASSRSLSLMDAKILFARANAY